VEVLAVVDKKVVGCKKVVVHMEMMLTEDKVLEPRKYKMLVVLDTKLGIDTVKLQRCDGGDGIFFSCSKYRQR